MFLKYGVFNEVLLAVHVSFMIAVEALLLSNATTARFGGTFYSSFFVVSTLLHSIFNSETGQYSYQLCPYWVNCGVPCCIVAFVPLKYGRFLIYFT